MTEDGALYLQIDDVDGFDPKRPAHLIGELRRDSLMIHLARPAIDHPDIHITLRTRLSARDGTEKVRRRDRRLPGK